jgi:hypothetical protein
VEFDATNSDPNAPEDILRELLFAGGAWGPSCVKVNSPFYEIHEVNDIAPFEIGICHFVDIFGDAYHTDNKLELVVKNPDGTTNSYLGPNPVLSLKYEYIWRSNQTDLLSQTGWYTIMIAEGPTIAKYYFYPPTVPRLYLNTGNELIFRNFVPNERIRLYSYQKTTGVSSLSFLAWQEIQADIYGQRVVRVNIQANYFVAVGEISGEVHAKSLLKNETNIPFPVLLFQSIQNVPCAGKPVSLPVAVGDRVRVPYYIYPGHKPVFFESYGFTGDRDDSIDVSYGEILNVIDGPICYKGEYYADQGDYWIMVENKEGKRAWVLQSEIELIPTLPEECPITLETLFQPGMLAKVVDNNGSVNLYESPDSSIPIHPLPGASVMFILDDVACRDGLIWRKVQAEDNSIGWIIESDGQYRFIEPFINTTPVFR